MQNYYPKYKILKKLNRCGRIPAIEFYQAFYNKKRFNPPVDLIESVLKKSIMDGLIQSDSSEISTANIEITPSGREYLQNAFDKAALFWVPYIITTIIAIAALIVSVYALSPQGCPSNHQIPPENVPAESYTDTAK